MLTVVNQQVPPDRRTSPGYQRSAKHIKDSGNERNVVEIFDSF